MSYEKRNNRRCDFTAAKLVSASE